MSVRERKNTNVCFILDKIGGFDINESFRTATIRKDKQLVTKLSSLSLVSEVARKMECVEKTERPNGSQGNVYERVHEPDPNGICVECVYEAYCPILRAFKEKQPETWI